MGMIHRRYNLQGNESSSCHFPSESVHNPLVVPSANLDGLADTVEFNNNGDPAQLLSTLQYRLDIQNDNVSLEDAEVFALHLNSPSDGSVQIGGTEDGVDYYTTTRVTVLDDDCE